MSGYMTRSGIAQSYGSSMGGMRDCCSQGLLEKSHQELIFACDSVDCYPRQTVTVQCHVKDLQAAWPHKRDADTTDIMECFS